MPQLTSRPRYSQDMTPNPYKRGNFGIELVCKLASLVVVAALLGAWVWFSSIHEAEAFNRLTTGPKVTTWDAVWLDLRVEAR
jgi:hypothetical protein